MAGALRTDIDAERAAVLFYGATLFVISVIVTGMCRYAARRPALLLDSITSAEIEQLSARTRPTPAFYGLAILLALLAPDVAAFGFLAIAVAAVLLPERSQRGV
jgi:hypothetical protein